MEKTLAFSLRVSIVIPMLNEEKHIGKCLDSVVNQSYPSELIEILVVDGMSTDGCVGVVNEYAAKFGNVRLLVNEKKITPVGLNVGISASSGYIVIILGAHSFVDVDFVKFNVEEIVTKDVDCSGGPIETISENEVAKSIALAMSSKFGVGNAFFRVSKNEMYVDTVAFGAYKRSTLDRIGFFDEELVRNQDYELNFRLINSGGRIYMNPRIKSYYYSRGSLIKLWRQYFQYGYWKVRVIQKHRKKTSLRYYVPVAFVLSLLVSGLGAVFSPMFAALLALIVGSHTVANLAFSAQIAIKHGLGNSKYVPVVFPILHFGFGFGFLSGVVRFLLVGRGGNSDRAS